MLASRQLIMGSWNRPIFLLGFSRYMSSRTAVNNFTVRSHTCGELRRAHVGEKAKICGWLEFKRMSRFLVLRDAYGSIQAVIPENRADLRKMIEKINFESVLAIEGIVVDRGEHSNSRMPTGNVEVFDKLTILNNTPPSLPYSLKTSSSHELGMKYRYLQLRSEAMQRSLRLRSSITQAMRTFLSEVVGFVEIETPTLFRRTPGGANEFIVPGSKPNNGLFYTLPQSPQQFKQLLMCAGFDRYYQIARCYRDETSKLDRQLEFTQVDIELSFTTQENVMQLIENLIAESWPPSLVEYRPSLPFKRMSYKEAYDTYGTDKPDLRIPWKILDFSLNAPFLNLQSSKDVAKCFIAKGCKRFITHKNRTEWKRMLELNTLAEPFHVLKFHDGDPSVDLLIEKLAAEMELNEEDAVVVAWGKKAGVQWTLGQLIRLIAETSSLRAVEKFEFVWITEFPLFAYNFDEKKYESVHHPFTAPIPSHENLLYDAKQLGNITAQHYDLVLNGVELGGGSIRVHDSKTQRYIVENILKESAAVLEHLLQALSLGAPPHGGFALGLDRYIALLVGKGNPNKPIRDVIAFPKTKEGKDIMCGSPAEVSEEVLKRYGLALRQPDLA